jgi:hypothetical protein
MPTVANASDSLAQLARLPRGEVVQALQSHGRRSVSDAHEPDSFPQYHAQLRNIECIHVRFDQGDEVRMIQKDLLMKSAIQHGLDMLDCAIPQYFSQMD